MLKNIVIFATAIGCIFMVSKFGLFIGGLSAILIGLLSSVLIYKLNERSTLKRLRDRINHLFIISRHPETDHSVELPGLYKYIVDAKHEEVVKTVKKYEALLVRSGNKFYNEEGLSEENKLKVIPIIFQDVNFKTETWAEFTFRAKQIITEEVNKWHLKLDKASGKKFNYQKHGNNQKT